MKDAIWRNYDLRALRHRKALWLNLISKNRLKAVVAG
jgi:hypothetical protein